MNLTLDKNLIDKYKNNSQKTRVISEAWTLENIFCPNCGSNIKRCPNNNPVTDFYCEKCIEDFELKAKNGKIEKKVTGSSYSSTIEKINSSQKPNFFFMSYILKKLSVNDFFVVPKHFFVSEIIEKRKPLKETAKRAGWTGSNILFSEIPEAGKIFYIENGKEIDKKEILIKWQKTVFLKKIKKNDEKSWILDVMNCIDNISKNDFSLEEIYHFEKDLAILHPENKNIKPKIRQQLQFLRNKGYLEFLGNGSYRLKK